MSPTFSYRPVRARPLFMYHILSIYRFKQRGWHYWISLPLSCSFVEFTRTMVPPIIASSSPLSSFFGLLILSSCSLEIDSILCSNAHLSQKVLPTLGYSPLTKAHGLGNSTGSRAECPRLQVNPLWFLPLQPTAYIKQYESPHFVTVP